MNLLQQGPGQLKLIRTPTVCSRLLWHERARGEEKRKTTCMQRKKVEEKKTEYKKQTEKCIEKIQIMQETNRNAYRKYKKCSDLNVIWAVGTKCVECCGVG